MRAYVSGTLALDLSSTLTPPGADPQPAREVLHRLQALRRVLTLTLRNPAPDENPFAPFWSEEANWLHIPRGFILTPEGRSLLAGCEIEDGRAGGFALSEGLACRTAFGAAPFPPGQPKFITDIVAGCKQNGHGGLALAPTRAGKTLCALEAAARLGGSTLVLVDRATLLRQWVEAIEGPHGFGIKAGVIQQDRFDIPPQFPFVVGMVETLARRQLSDSFRSAFRTVIVDECSSAATATTLAALKRVASSYVIGLTATPDRKDGLTQAISWMIGPVIAELHRDLEADVHFLHLEFKHTMVVKQDEFGGEVEKKPRILRPNGQVNIVGVEQSLCADDSRVMRIAQEAMTAMKAGRRVLIFVALRAHVLRLKATLTALGYAPGIFIGGQDDLAAMKKDICLTTFQMAAKGVDFQPPFTLIVIAAPRADVRQAMGRVLNPQAPCKPMILDVVDGHKVLVGLGLARAKQYREKGFDIRNRVWPEEI
jgi:superfamily II DNA or RNA helicase